MIQKNTIFKSSWTVSVMTLGLWLTSIVGCTPRPAELFDTSFVRSDVIDSIALKPSNDYLIASAANEVDLTPVCYYTARGQKQIIPVESLSDDIFEWRDADGKVVPRHFSTTDLSLVDSTLTFTLHLKGDRALKSLPASVKVVDPVEFQETYRIPIIFHVIQSTTEVSELGVQYDYEIIRKQIDKLNNVFGNKICKTATGVDAMVRFEPALYDPYGNRLSEPGLNRVVYDFEFAPDPEKNPGYDLPQVYKIIRDAKAVWDHDRYFNIWLVSEASDKITDFGNQLEFNFVPEYWASTEVVDDVPANLYLNPMPQDLETLELRHFGLAYRLQDLLASRSASNNTNELIYYIGHFFGLYPSSLDELKLTVRYEENKAGFYLKNNTDMKETATNFFRSTNIMDDRFGGHVSISQDQAQVVHWVLKVVSEKVCKVSSPFFPWGMPQGKKL